MNRFSKSIYIICCLTLLLSLATNVSAMAETKCLELSNNKLIPSVGSSVNLESQNTEISVLVNNKKIIFSDAKPYLKNGSTLLPLRACAEDMGAQVFWNNTTSEIFIYRDGIEVRMKINSNTMSIQKYTFINNQMAYIAEKEEKWIDIPAEIDTSSGRTYVPLRVIGEIFNADVQWEKDGMPRTVSIDNLSVMTEAKSKIDKNMHMFVNVLFYDVPTIPQKAPVTIFVYTTIDGEQKPVGDATVIIEGIENIQGKTYTNGKVSVFDVPVGERKITVQKDGYYMENSNFVVNISKEDLSEKIIEVVAINQPPTSNERTNAPTSDKKVDTTQPTNDYESIKEIVQ